MQNILMQILVPALEGDAQECRKVIERYCHELYQSGHKKEYEQIRKITDRIPVQRSQFDNGWIYSFMAFSEILARYYVRGYQPMGDMLLSSDIKEQEMLRYVKKDLSGVKLSPRFREWLNDFYKSKRF